MLQMAVLPLLIIFQRLCLLLPLLSFIHITSILTLYLNTSLWIWSLFLLISSATCGTGTNNPVFLTGVIMVSFLFFLSLIDCALSREGRNYLCSNLFTYQTGWSLLDLRQKEEASKYFGGFSIIFSILCHLLSVQMNSKPVPL